MSSRKPRRVQTGADISGSLVGGLVRRRNAAQTAVFQTLLPIASQRIREKELAAQGHEVPKHVLNTRAISRPLGMGLTEIHSATVSNGSSNHPRAKLLAQPLGSSTKSCPSGTPRSTQLPSPSRLPSRTSASIRNTCSLCAMNFPASTPDSSRQPKDFLFSIVSSRSQPG